MRPEQGKFDLLIQEEKDFVMETVAGYHYRTGRVHQDGSMGVIKITPQEFNDCLAHTLRRGF